MVHSFQLNTTSHLFFEPIRLPIEVQPIPTVEPSDYHGLNNSHTARHGWRTANGFAEADSTIPHEADDYPR